MKRDLIVLKNHSFVDVITNSSSELFVADTKKSLETVKEILHMMIDTYNKCNEDSPRAFDDIFGDIDVITEDSKDHIDEYVSWRLYDERSKAQKKWLKTNEEAVEIEKELKSFEKKRNSLDSSGEKRFSDLREKMWKIEEKFDNEFNDKWIKSSEGKKIIGKIFIHSRDDNSIPYELFELIESAFNCERYHLG